MRTKPAFAIAKLFLLLFLPFYGIAQTNPDVPDFAQLKGTDKQAFMERRAEAIGLRRGVEKDKPFDPSKRISAVRQMENQKSSILLRQNSQRVSSILAAWTELGPNPIPNGQVGTGPQLPVSGRTISIAVHPTNPDIVYVGTAQGGLYRSLNGGATWVPLLDNALSLAINTVAICPSQPTTIFVGTGEANFSVDSYFGVGIYRIDNAESGSPTVSGPLGSAIFQGRAVSKIVVHPTNPNIIFAGSAAGGGGINGGANNVLANRGIFRSTDALSASPTFTQLTITGIAAQNRNVVDIVMDPGNPDLVLFTIGDSFNAGEGGVYRSTNALAGSPSFVRTFTAGIGTEASRTELALNRTAGVVTVYAASGFNGGTVQRSVDGGATWTQTIDNNFCTPQCFYDIAIAVDPIDATRVYLGGAPTLAFGISVNSGVTFTNNAATAQGLHVDSHVIGVSPSNPAIIYFGSDGGIYKSTTIGTTWVSLNNSTFRATQFMGLSVHPTDPNFTIGGTQDNGTNMLRPDGTWFRVDFGDGGYSVIDQNATNTTTVDMYHTYFNASNLTGYAYRGNGTGATEGTWAFRGCQGVTANGITCTGTINFYAPLEQGPGNPNSIYYGSNRLWRSIDKGLNHTAASQTFTSPLSAIGISPQDDNVRIIGLNDGRIFGTTTGSATLTDMDPGNNVPAAYVARAVIDPNNVNTAYVTLSAFGVVNVWKTTNLNSATPTWTAAATGIPQVPVNAFIVDPANSNNLFAGTDIGVYSSDDGGASWDPFGTGLPAVAVFDMAIQPVAQVLRIATHGRGMWQIPLGVVVTTFYPRTTATDLSLVSNWTDAPSGTGGNSPANFSSPNQLFNLNTNVANPVVNGSWGISGGSNLVLNNTAPLLFTTTANFSLGSGSTADFNGKPVTLKSSATGTAFMGIIEGSLSNASNVTVERYLSSNNNRAYRLLAPSVNTATNIRANWQENGSSASGLGTHITGSTTGANGFDITQTGEGSLFTYNPVTPAWEYISNTDVNTLNAKNGYLLYVRGDRTIDLNSTDNPLPSNNTTLRATGTLLTGAQSFTGLTGNSGFSLVTNPYASPINWLNVYGASTGLTQFYTLWDPNIASQGGYVTVSASGMTSNASSNATTSIQSGQAFFVQASGAPAPVVNVMETHKSPANNIDVFRLGSQTELFTSSLFYTDANGKRIIADGITSVYSNAFNKTVDGNDATQIANWDEDIAIARGGNSLSIESRPLIDIRDTIPFIMARLQQRSYEWQFNANGFTHPNLFASLVDNFTGITKPVSLNGVTVIQFTVTGNPASSAANRFMVVFGPNVALPVNMSNVKAYQKGKDIQVEWTAQTEWNLDKYEVEESVDARQFTKATTVIARGISTATTYDWLDVNVNNGSNYYRIKAISKTGEVQYSKVVRVNIGKAVNEITVYPNPTNDNIVTLSINLPKGQYTVTLTNKLGQQVYAKQINHLGGASTQTLRFSPKLAQGIYQLTVSDGETNYVQQLMKE